MKTTLRLAAAFVLTGLCFSANAQGTKPMAKDSKMAAATEEKMETKKVEKMEMAKSTKMMRPAAKMSQKKVAAKNKM